MHESFGSIVAEAVEISFVRVCLAAALYGETTLKRGRVEQASFDSYRKLQLAQMPKVAVSIIESDAISSGVGESSTPPIGPALAPIFAATGRRLRFLPIVKNGIEVS